MVMTMGIEFYFARRDGQFHNFAELGVNIVCKMTNMDMVLPGKMNLRGTPYTSFSMTSDIQDIN